MMSFARFLRVSLLASAAAVYLGLGYVAAAWPHPPLAAVLASLAPLLALGLTAAWQSPWPVPALGLCAVTLLELGLHVQALREHAAALAFVQHVGAMSTLAFSFGATLRGPPAQALCSRVARVCIAGDIAPDYYLYTWRVTAAWTAFFVALGLSSVLLFTFGPVAWWSALANVLTPLLVGAMFVGEYLVRVRLMPDRPHMSIAETVRAYHRLRQARP